MNRAIAFFPHNMPHLHFFKKVGEMLNKSYGFDIYFIRELGQIEGVRGFQFEKEIEKIWSEIDISCRRLEDLRKEYPGSNLMRALYSERSFNFFPRYFSRKPVPYKRQLRYLVGCFIVFKRFLLEKNIRYIVSELLIGLPDSVLYEICKKYDIEFIAIRPAKLSRGVIKCKPEEEGPKGLLEVYRGFLETGIPADSHALATAEIEAIRSRIVPPAYMEASKKEFKLIDKERIPLLLKKFGKDRMRANSVSRVRHPILESFLWHLHRFFNIRRTRFVERNWFHKQIPVGEKYFVFPLQYEPEASTLVRAFPFSDQMCLIQHVAKLLPLGITLLVKEHRGNHGYRKPQFYRELTYLPNVKLVPREADVHNLVRNSIGVITLTSRMGWEALVLRKPVIAFGSAFWTDFEDVIKPKSWEELSQILEKCVVNGMYGDGEDSERRLVAYAAAYISQIHGGVFLARNKAFLSKENVENIAGLIKAEVSSQ